MFLNCIIFLLWRTFFFNISCKAGLLVTISSICALSEKASLCCFWEIITLDADLSWWLSSFNSKYLTSYSSCLHHFWKEVWCNCYLCSSVDKFSHVFSCHWFSVVWIYSLAAVWYLSYLMLFESSWSAIWCMSLILENSQPLLPQYFFFWYPDYIYVIFNNCTTVHFILFVFLFVFHLWKFY